MKIKDLSVLAIRHDSNTTLALMIGTQCVWKVPWFDVRDLTIYQPKESYYGEVGDVLFVDKDNNKELYSKDTDFYWLKEQGYRPIGIVTIPGKFNVYGNCAVNCIALNYISGKTPEDGTSYEEENVFFNSDDPSTYFDYGSEFNSSQGVTIVDDFTTKEIKGFYDQPILPSDYWNGTDNDYVLSNDGIGYYLKLGIGNNANTTNRAYSPSPYYPDQSQQELWWYSTQTQQKTSQSNFNGEELTNLYLSKYSGAKVNAINYIKKYSPQKSNTAGEWFLGATGEMAMMICRVGVLNNTITKLRQVFGLGCAAFFQSKTLMTANIPDDGSTTNGLRNKCIGMKSVVISNEKMSATDLLCKPMIKFENTKNKVKINIEWDNYIQSITLNGRIYYPWSNVGYIEMPIGSLLKWSAEITQGYKTSEPTSGEIILEEEITIRFDEIEEDLSYEIDINEYSIESWDAVAGDYLFVNAKGQLFLTKKDVQLSELKDKGCTPIGVVVVPGHHNVYGDCSVGCIALKYLSNTNNTGSDSSVLFKFCNSDTHNIDLPYYKTGVVLNGSQTRTIKGFVERPGVSSDYLSPSSSQPTSLDGETQYFESKITSNLSVYGYCPSPYTEDGGANDLYWYADTSTKYSAQRDVFGKENTNYIANTVNLDEYPGVKYVKEFAPAGAPLTKGMWYIQGSGELGYSINRMKKIIDSITALSGIYPGIKITPTDFYTKDYFTSTVLDAGKMRNGPGNNIWLIGCNNSTKELNIKPFIRINSTKHKSQISFDWSSVNSITINGRVYYPWDNINKISVKKGSTINWKIDSNTGLKGGEFVIDKDTTLPLI